MDGILDEISLFVLDMDGTFYLGEKLIDGAVSFLDRAREAGRKVMFFTNNASTTSERYVEKLKRLGVDVKALDIPVMTSGDVMISFLNTYHAGKSVYVLGTKALTGSFKEAGIDVREMTDDPGEIDIVVVSFDMELTYEKLTFACDAIRGGAVFLSTHPDINCPTETGFIPDSGAIVRAVSASSGKEPRYTGKPDEETVKAIERLTGIDRSKTAYVGDRLYTDVRTGTDNGAKGILVLSGETKAGDLEGSSVVPHAVFDSIAEIGERL